MKKMKLRAEVNKWHPRLEVIWIPGTKALNSVMQSKGNSINEKLAILEYFCVYKISYEGRRFIRNAPHCSNNVPEACCEHPSGDVNCFIRLFFFAFGGFTCRKEGKLGIEKLCMNQFLECQSAIVQE